MEKSFIIINWYNAQGRNGHHTHMHSQWLQVLVVQESSATQHRFYWLHNFQKWLGMSPLSKTPHESPAAQLAPHSRLYGCCVVFRLNSAAACLFPPDPSTLYGKEKENNESVEVLASAASARAVF